MLPLAQPQILRPEARFFEQQPIKRDQVSEIFCYVLNNETRSLRAHLRCIEKIDVNVKIQGWTPLHVAASKGNKAMVEVLLNHGARLNAVTEGTRMTALQIATMLGCDEVINLLFNKEKEGMASKMPRLTKKSGFMFKIKKVINKDPIRL